MQFFLDVEQGGICPVKEPIDRKPEEEGGKERRDRVPRIGKEEYVCAIFKPREGKYAMQQSLKMCV